jgi:LPXTG-motif cell wall-anchored protein
VTATASPSQRASHSATAKAAHSASPKPRKTSHQVANVAPDTGGGGTAGFQDSLLLALGLAAVLAGAGSIYYRRRLMRHR